MEGQLHALDTETGGGGDRPATRLLKPTRRACPCAHPGEGGAGAPGAGAAGPPGTAQAGVTPPLPAPCHGPVSVEGRGNVSPGPVPPHGSPSSRLLFRRFSWPVGSTFLGVCLRVPDLHSAGSRLLVDHPAAFLLQFVYFSVLEVSFFNIFICILEQT